MRAFLCSLTAIAAAKLRAQAGEKTQALTQTKLHLASALQDPRIEEKTPTPCQAADKYSQEFVEGVADAYIAKYSSHEPLTAGPNSEPVAILLLGGSGAGKSTFINKLRRNGVDLDSFVFAGLDEYLDYIPEYEETLSKKATVVYKDAADACYGVAIRIGQLVNQKILENKMNFIYEETGKDLKRIQDRVLPMFRGYHLVLAMVDNDADVAISRAGGRFTSTGRYSPADYIRGSFAGGCDSWKALSDAAQNPALAENVYCDNRGRGECWRVPVADEPRREDDVAQFGDLAEDPQTVCGR